MKSLSYEKVVYARPGDVWAVISDVGNYADIAPNIDTSRIVSGEGMGMVRECSNKEGRWQEVCSQWLPGEQFAFDVQTRAADYPYPFTYLNAIWSVVPIDETSTKIKMDFNVEFSSKVLGLFMFPLLKLKFSGVCRTLLDNWQRDIEQRH